MYGLELAFGAIIVVFVVVFAACLIAVGIDELLADDLPQHETAESGYKRQRVPWWEELRLMYYEYKLDRLADQTERKLERLRSRRPGAAR